MGIMVWIIIGIVFLVICIGGAKNRKSSGSRGNPTRIDHPHYFDRDDCECSVCGARFGRKQMTCPRCGARFQETRRDENEFIEEMEILDDD